RRGRTNGETQERRSTSTRRAAVIARYRCRWELSTPSSPLTSTTSVMRPSRGREDRRWLRGRNMRRQLVSLGLVSLLALSACPRACHLPCLLPLRTFNPFLAADQYY